MSFLSQGQFLLTHLTFFNRFKDGYLNRLILIEICYITWIMWYYKCIPWKTFPSLASHLLYVTWLTSLIKHAFTFSHLDWCIILQGVRDTKKILVQLSHADDISPGKDGVFLSIVFSSVGRGNSTTMAKYKWVRRCRGPYKTYNKNGVVFADKRLVSSMVRCTTKKTASK